MTSYKLHSARGETWQAGSVRGQSNQELKLHLAARGRGEGVTRCGQAQLNSDALDVGQI